MTVETARTGRSGSTASTSARRWLLAIATALLLHGSVAAWALLELRSTELDDEADGSALPIDLTALTAVLSDDIAPRIGLPTPEVAAQQATPQRDSAEPPPVEKTEVAIDQPSPSEATVAMPKPQPEKTEEKKDEPDNQPPQPAVAAADAQDAARCRPYPLPRPPSRQALLQAYRRRSENRRRRGRRPWSRTSTSSNDIPMRLVPRTPLARRKSSSRWIARARCRNAG